MEILSTRPEDGLGNLLSYIAFNYLLNTYCTCIFLHSSKNFDDALNSFLNNISTESDQHLHTPSFSNFDIMMQRLKWDAELVDSSDFNDKILEYTINYGCQAFIVSHEVSIEFMNSYAKAMYLGEQRFSQNKFIFVQSDDIDRAVFRDRILNHTVITDVPNILIITSATTTSKPIKLNHNSDNGNNEYSFDLTTSQFVGRYNNNLPILLDTFYGQNNTFKKNANLFPDKLSNLQGRVVKLALFNYKPYTVWQEVPSGLGNANTINTAEEKTLSIDGTESLMILEFCSKHNCTLEISLDEEGEWGTIFDNRTGIGVIGAVAERRADVGISALYEWHHEYQFLDFSTPMTRTGITCIVPKPKLLPGWKIPAMPFSWPLWLAVLTSFLVGIISIICSKTLTIRKTNAELSIDGIFLQVGAVFLSQSSSLFMTRIPEMIILGGILLIGLLSGNAYSGGLASIMTVPQYEPPIDTAHQLAAKNLEWGATHDAWIFSILQATQPDIKKLVDMFDPLPFKELQKRAETGDFAFSIERLPYGSYAIGEYITHKNVENLQLMHYDIYYEYALAMCYKTWPLILELDTLILNVVQSGIQQYWENQVVMKVSDEKVQLAVSTSRLRHRGDHGPSSLQVSQLIGAFILWTFGLTLATISFICENFTYRLKNRNNLTKITFL